MSDVVVVEFPSEAKTEEVRQKLLDMQSEYLIELQDAVIAIKQPRGRIKLNQLFHPAAAGAAYGSMWGLLVGMIFLMPVAGVAVGAASGALGGRSIRFRSDMAQNGIDTFEENGEAVLKMGCGGRENREEGHMATESAIRGMYQYYREVMGL